MTRSHLRHGTGPHLSTSPKKKEAELGWDWPWPRAKGGSFVWIPVLHSSQDSVPLRPLVSWILMFEQERPREASRGR